MSNKLSSNARERTRAAIDADQEAAKASKYTPKATITKPSRKVPSAIDDKTGKTADDHSVQVPIHFSTIFAASICLIITTAFCVSNFWG
ncbi:unnamed protein product [Didymodactylos carnosus]|uniref:Uncharacterized protein n=1 Tax=Didymodactylos carnosus TaxID=1234261 RepID=A0A816EC33_9BILA|nr:unnamed protein product [Didymodactylos carnosus]CAF1647033.1 unnamed protein product [Didymodactylos carnosus]CAF4370488.1 unnamed protein product [Didymodactylos carnosus]CAF4568138.1 unnamed protein product [Didymodactylos carnosus]